MKIICCLFSLYFILLTGVTCADKVSGTQGIGKELAVQHDHDTAGNDHNNPGDNCSPFCGCQCCHLNIFLTPVDVHFTRNFIPQFYTVYFSDIPEKKIVESFKPPKFRI